MCGSIQKGKSQWPWKMKYIHSTTYVIQLSAAGLISAGVVGVERLREKERRKAEDE